MSTSPFGAGRVRYGDAALADVLPSALSALGVPGESNPLQLAPARAIVVLLVDGLGRTLLDTHAGAAPFLGTLAGRTLTAGFPTTTAVSLASLGTGLPPGEHGITGYTSRLGESTDPVNWLTWRRAHGAADLRTDFPPEQVQSSPTAFERAERAGVDVSVVSSHAFDGSGLTRAVLRGGTYRPVFTAADLVTTVAAAVTTPGPALAYCYFGDLDLIGHVRGPGDPAWAVQLTLVDRFVELLAQRLPPDVRLLVTADHGMVEIDPDERIDVDTERDLATDVEVIAGEGRARYLHVRAGCVDAVRARWAARGGGQLLVLTREEVVERGWYGPTVTPAAAERIGDLVVLATGAGAVVRSRAEPRVSRMRGQHGSLTDDELLVPLLST